MVWLAFAVGMLAAALFGLDLGLRRRALRLAQLPRLLGWHSAGAAGPLRHVFLCVADHYEPCWGRPSSAVARERVARWRRDYPDSLGRFADVLGRPPQHTFFYPAEEYAPEYLDPLGELVRLGLGDVEIHLHHRNDTSDGLRETLARFKQQLVERHGLLRRDAKGRIVYGFIHGNWCLDNSHPTGDWCGVNDELSILLETGCYADFTLPAAPDPAQTRTINSIYYAVDDPLRPKSHDRGAPAAVGRPAPAGSLLVIQGPLALDFRQRKAWVLPRLENADLHARRPPDAARLELWLRSRVHVAGRPDWTFVKLHTHGAPEANAEMLLGPRYRAFHQHLADRALSDAGFRYYYVTAAEMADLVHQAEAGASEPKIRGCCSP